MKFRAEDTLQAREQIRAAVGKYNCTSWLGYPEQALFVSGVAWNGRGLLTCDIDVIYTPDAAFRTVLLPNGKTQRFQLYELFDPADMPELAPVKKRRL